MTNEELISKLYNEGYSKCTGMNFLHKEEFEYDGCLHNLERILNEIDTTVTKLTHDDPHYEEGKDVYLMDAPCMEGKFWIWFDKDD